MRGSKSGKCFLLIMYSSPAASACLALARLESGGQIQRALKWLFRENFVLLHVRTSCHHGDLLILSLFGWECESESRDEWTGQFPERESVSEILRLPHQILCWNFCNASERPRKGNEGGDGDIWDGTFRMKNGPSSSFSVPLFCCLQPCSLISQSCVISCLPFSILLKNASYIFYQAFNETVNILCVINREGSWFFYYVVKKNWTNYLVFLI